jgi:RNA polymerase sigma factor (sigma-70 family)
LTGLSWHDLLQRLRSDVELRAHPDRAEEVDNEAWKEVQLRIRGYAERILGERHGLSSADLDDLTQVVLLKLQSLAIIERLQSLQFPTGYLVVMLRNSANDLARRRSVERDVAPLMVQEPSLPEEEIQERQERQRRALWLDEELRRLPEADRRLLAMRFWEGKRINEIAGTLGLPYSRVAVRLFRLLRKLESRSGTALRRDRM